MAALCPVAGSGARAVSEEPEHSPRRQDARRSGAGETSFSYGRKVQPRLKLGPWIEVLDGYLEANEKKPRRDRLSLMRMYEELAALGYAGGYDAVRRYASVWRRERRALPASQAFVPLSFAPGEAYQFDWSHEYAVLSGVTTRVKAAHMRLCHSRLMLVQVFAREGQEMVFEAHERTFRFFGGSCRRGIYDNMKTAVSAVFIGKERAYNRRFLEMCSHHLVEPVACTPGAAWEKGQVENQVGYARGRLFVPRPRGRSYEELNAWLMDACIRDAKRRAHPSIAGKTVWEVFEEEQPFLVGYCGPFDGFHAVESAVSKTCLVRFDNNHYSVAARAVGRPVDVRAYADRIVIRQDGETVAEHPRSFARGTVSYDPRPVGATVPLANPPIVASTSASRTERVSACRSSGKRPTARSSTGAPICPTSSGWRILRW